MAHLPPYRPKVNNNLLAMSSESNFSVVCTNSAKILYYLPYYIYLFFSTLVSSLLEKINKEPKNLNKETILVTGASSGIGQQVVCDLAQKFPKAKYILWGTNEKNLQETACQCKAFGAKDVFVYQVDVSKKQNIREAAAKVRLEVGPVTVLFCNAGITQNSLFVNADEILEERVITVNLLSYMWTVREFLGDMISAGKGHLIFTNSFMAFYGYPNFAGYVASKYGLRGFVEVLKLELLQHPGKPDISVTQIFPGLVKTPILDGALDKTCRYKFDGFEPIDVGYAAEVIVDGILKEKETVVMPKWFTIIDIFCRIMPTKFLSALMSHVFLELDENDVDKNHQKPHGQTNGQTCLK